ncbi:MAG: pyridoxal phosphate-dependent aminotransferase [Lachnospiraceae bacterium]|nr:pyridoxal phosphate-dependent aminotransferase [Lachnospiraceae bacterium]
MDRDFNQIIDRHNTNSLKYDFALQRGKSADVLPMWVADMDFQAPTAVCSRLEELSRFGIFGYSDNQTSYFDAVLNWYQKHFNWTAKKEWILRTPGVVFAIAAAIRGLTEEGDAVLIQEPVYYPFSSIITQNKRKKIINPLVNKNGHYEMDLDDMEQKIIDNHVKLFLLCSPHNPVGRVWTLDELEAVGNLCQKHGVIIVSDEIHSDFTFEGHTHYVFASVSDAFAQNSVICTSPSKTFNIAGLQISNIFVPNPNLRKKVKDAIAATSYCESNYFALAACETAYREGETWLNELRKYLTDNLHYVYAYLMKYLPEIRLVEPEGTYLLWLDCRNLKMTEKERIDAIENKGKLWLDTGSMFGEAGTGYERINIACPRATLEECLNRLRKAFS